MSVGRAYHKATKLDGFLYVTGGSDGTTTLDVVERYDPRENIWTIVAPMIPVDKITLCPRSMAVYMPSEVLTEYQY
ncbi:kelch repeat protein [Cooperia oncophora]